MLEVGHSCAHRQRGAAIVRRGPCHTSSRALSFSQSSPRISLVPGGQSTPFDSVTRILIDQSAWLVGPFSVHACACPAAGTPAPRPRAPLTTLCREALWKVLLCVRLTTSLEVSTVLVDHVRLTLCVASEVAELEKCARCTCACTHVAQSTLHVVARGVPQFEYTQCPCVVVHACVETWAHWRHVRGRHSQLAQRKVFVSSCVLDRLQDVINVLRSMVRTTSTCSSRRNVCGSVSIWAL